MLYWNEAAEKMYNIKKEDIINLKVFESEKPVFIRRQRSTRIGHPPAITENKLFFTTY